VNLQLAMTLTNRYVCSRCWGPLIAVSVDTILEIICAQSTLGKCNGQGYVTRRYAERRRQDSLMEISEIRRNYGFLLSKPRLTQKEILVSLGF